MKTIIEMAREAGDDWDSTLSTDKEFLKRFAELVAKKYIEKIKDLEDFITELQERT
jgi:hypothetical protein